MNADAALVASLRGQLLGAVGDALGGARRVALLDFPNHPNAGDTAIWLGTRAALRDLGVEIAYTASFSTWSARALRRRIGAGGTVMLHGGGNFGDIWPTYHAFRQRVADAHRDNRLVQMPQSAHWRDPSNAARRSTSLAAHPDLVLLVRDRPSLESCRVVLPNAQVKLAPDAAFALGCLDGGPPSQSVVRMLRTDDEGVLNRAALRRHDIVDWAKPTRAQRSRYRESRLIGYPMKRWSLPFPGLWEAALARTFADLGASRLSGGLDLIARGEILVTDRLHGHILAILLGRRNVVLDNEYGKIRRFREAWTADSVLSASASTLAEADELAESLRLS